MKRLLLLGLTCVGLAGCVVAEQPQYGYAPPPQRVVYAAPAPVYVQQAPVVVEPVYFGGYHGGYYHRRGYR